MANFLEQSGDASTLVDLLPIGTMLSHGRVIININELFAGMFGYKRDELLGKSIELLYPSFREYVDRGDQWHGFLHRSGEHCDERIMLSKGDNPVWARVKGRCRDRNDPYALIACTFELAEMRQLPERQPTTAVSSDTIRLNARERAIVKSMGEGLTSKQIARQLNLSPRTVETYRARLMAKTGAQNASHLLTLIGGAVQVG